MDPAGPEAERAIDGDRSPGRQGPIRRINRVHSTNSKTGNGDASTNTLTHTQILGIRSENDGRAPLSEFLIQLGP